MISSYTANLAAFLTIERLDTPIQSVEDLAKAELLKFSNIFNCIVWSGHCYFEFIRLLVY